MVALFDETYYLAENPDVASAVKAGIFTSGYQHFLLSGDKEGRNPNSLFNTEYYLAHNTDVENAIQDHLITSAWDHFISYGQYEGRSPVAGFDEQTYLAQNPDVAQAVANHQFTSGWEHAEMYGIAEGRITLPVSPVAPIQPTLPVVNNNTVDATWYLSAYSDVKDAGIDPTTHYNNFGIYEGRLPNSPDNLKGSDNIAGTPDVPNTLHGGAGNDILTGANKSDTLFGETGDDLLIGNDGNNVLNGGSGNDTIYGSQYAAGKDSLVGANGTEVILAGDGNDYIDVSRADSLDKVASQIWGGSGNDTFAINTKNGASPFYGIIEDFHQGEDKIELSSSFYKHIVYNTDGHTTTLFTQGIIATIHVVFAGNIHFTDSDFNFV